MIQFFFFSVFFLNFFFADELEICCCFVNLYNIHVFLYYYYFHILQPLCKMSNCSTTLNGTRVQLLCVLHLLYVRAKKTLFLKECFLWSSTELLYVSIEHCIKKLVNLSFLKQWNIFAPANIFLLKPLCFFNLEPNKILSS